MKVMIYIEKERDFEKIVESLADALNDMVAVYKMIESKSDGFADPEYRTVSKIVLPQGSKFNILLKKKSLDYIMSPRSLLASEVEVLKGESSYMLYVSTPIYVEKFMIPPVTIFDSLHVLMNRDLVSFVAESTGDPDLRTMVDDLYATAEGVVFSAPNVDEVEIDKTDSARTLIAEDIGRMLRSISVDAYYDPYAEDILFEFAATIMIGNDKILYYVPRYSFDEYVKSLATLLAFLGAEDDIHTLSRAMKEYKRIVTNAYILIDAYRKYMDE